jgi:hypothetical protein
MGKLPFYAAGAGAGALTSILDLLKDSNQGTIARVGSMLKENLFGGHNLFFSPVFWAIVLLICVSLFVCWVFEVTSKLDGFLRGCTILAAFSIGAPSPIINKQLTDIGSSFVGAQLTGLPFGISKALAQAPSEADKSTIGTGEAYIVLDHLKPMIPRPDSPSRFHRDGPKRYFPCHDCDLQDRRQYSQNFAALWTIHCGGGDSWVHESFF